MNDPTRGAIDPTDSRLPEETNVSERVFDYRQQRGLSLRELARRSGVSASFLQQLESGRSNASIASLKRISVALGVSVAQLLASDTERTRGVLRAADRPIYSTDGGAVKYALSLPPIVDVEIYQATFAPGGSTGSADLTHEDCQEFLIVLSGTVSLWLGEQKFVLSPNDSIEYRGSTEHRLVNESSEDATVIWVTGPDVPARKDSSPSGTHH
jgi:transcriptional regulator with XRE-family HTH domain